LRSQNSPQEVLELKTLIHTQANEIAALRDRLQEAMRKKLKAVELFDKNDLFQSY
jgi:hypothetical protein